MPRPEPRPHQTAGEPVHVVIVNWNTGRHLTTCLESLEPAAAASLLRRVTVVDNDSKDGSVDSLEDVVVPLEIIRNRRNLGFAAACNQGATGSEADYLLFLNPDTKLLPDTLPAVVEFMESDRATRVGICGVDVVDSDGRSALSCSRFPTLRIAVGRATGLRHVLPSLFPKQHLSADETRQSRSVDQVIGAFYLVRRHVFERLGGFDERYFMYYEDVDFALRARRIGAASYFLKEARVHHAENVSSDRVHRRRLAYSLHSRLLYAAAHWPPWQSRGLVLVTFGVEPIARLFRAVASRKEGSVEEVLQGYLLLIRALRSSSRGRKGGAVDLWDVVS